MKVSGERYSPLIGHPVFAAFEPFVSYEHWHRYCFALPFVKGKSVLDIASGEGYGSAFLAGHAQFVYGIDLSREAVEHASASYVRDNLRYLQGAAEAIPIPGEHCFDVIVSFETIEHLDAAGQERFAAEIARLLKPDGVLLVSTPNRETYSPEGAQGNPYHFHEFTKDEYVAFLHRWFTHVQILSQHVYPVSYIWNPHTASRSIVEYQVRIADGRFHPEEGDAKDIGYLIAVCANREEPIPCSDSLLVDLSEVAFRGIPELRQWQTTSLFFDTGAGFRAEEVIQEQTEYTPEFLLEFALDPSTPVQQLRWDPLEMRLCRVRLRQVFWQDGDGLLSRVDLGRVTSNGRQRGEDTFEFETLDPMIVLPISGRVARVVIQGECEAADDAQTRAGLEAALRSRTDVLVRQEHDLQALRQRLALVESESATFASKMHRELQDRDRELSLARDERARAEAALAGVFRSRSWRITTPLRTSARLARGVRARVRRAALRAVAATRN